jgi:hypothetical protein
VFDALSERGFRSVQLDAAEAGMRPRDLDRSARRGLVASLRRRGLTVSGLDLWIPPAHFLDPARADRAVAAVTGAISLAAELGHCPVSVTLPRDQAGEDVADTLSGYGEKCGVALADHGLPPAEDDRMSIGIDPAALLADGQDPCQAVARCAGALVTARLCDLTTDGMRAPIGDRVTARLDVTSYRVALSVAGYQHPVVVDTRQWSDPWAGLQQTRAAWDAADQLRVDQ